MPSRNVVGCMTGTSMDAIDAALVTVHGAGLQMRVAVRRCATQPLGSLVAPLHQLASLEPMSAGRIAKLARDLAFRHVTAVRKLTSQERVDLIAVHGQTVFHAPPVSWQLLVPAPIADAFQVPVVFDLRAADLAAGGQGAPITPLADYVLFRHDVETRAIVNLGGYANYTLLPGRSVLPHDAQEDWVRAIRGGDICVCNQLLDAVARDLFGQPFDEGGQLAATGEVRSDLRDSLVGLLRGQGQMGRSLGTGDELGGWIDEHRGRHPGEDLARSACEVLAIAVSDTIAEVAQRYGFSPVNRVLLAGGGLKNRVLTAAFQRHSQAEVGPTDDFGVPASHREAAAMAVLGALCQDGVPITLPHVTGVREPAPLAGAWICPSSG
jgi:anhydro-N-acetylmuramic acid kinase